MGYVLRMSNMNKLWGTRWLCQLLGRKSHFQILPGDIDRIANIFGVPKTDLDRLYVFSDLIGGRIVLNAHGHLIKRVPLLRHLRPQLCPACLAEHGYARAAWDFSLVCACPFHYTALIDQCPACQKDIRWSRPAIAVCQCGFHFAKASGAVMEESAPEVIMATIVQGALVGDRNIVQRFQDPVSSMLGRLSLDTLFRMVWIFGMRQPGGLEGGGAALMERPKTHIALKAVRLAYARILAVHRNAPTFRANAPAVIHVPSIVRLTNELVGTEDGFVLASIVENLRLGARATSLPVRTGMRQLELFRRSDI